MQKTRTDLDHITPVSVDVAVNKELTIPRLPYEKLEI